MNKNENIPYRGCQTCKYWDKRTYGGEVPNGYCVEDGDQVFLAELKQFCYAWKDRNDKTPDIDWP